MLTGKNVRTLMEYFDLIDVHQDGSINGNQQLHLLTILNFEGGGRGGIGVQEGHPLLSGV